MSDIAIKVENLSKRYRIGLKEQKAETLMGELTNWLKAPFANFRNLRSLSHFSENGHDSDDVIYALKDVSFEVRQGEVVGIIGRNGAGKSTLLKILSKITEPTSGRATINGRVSSLLEVGTGFHPELTGRENIYLNGTVLGMTKKEIDRNFDEIVDFSGVEKFIDTPVKRYSSGMQVRLAFAVAAHLEPEILLVDEVLAVGDVEFQKKCLGKMGEVARAGRTVLFVSHNMGAVEELCEGGLLIENGMVNFVGNVKEAIAIYLRLIEDRRKVDQDNPRNCGVEFGKVEINGNDYGEIVSDATFSASVSFRIHHSTSLLRLNCVLLDSRRTKVLHLQTTTRELGLEILEPGSYHLQVRLPALWIAAGSYALVFKLRDLANPDYEGKIESDYLPITVTGKYTNFGTPLAPPGDWQLSSKRRLK